MLKRKDSMINQEIYFNHRKPWTESDDNELMALSQEYPDKEIAVMLGRTVSSIWRRRQVLHESKFSPSEHAL